MLLLFQQREYRTKSNKITFFFNFFEEADAGVLVDIWPLQFEGRN